MIHTSVEKVTPITAKNWLETNTMNRPISEREIRKYAAAMQRGDWTITGEPIVFSEQGVLTDGQHRLLACIRSGVPFDTVVVRGVGEGAFAVTNTGKSRSAGDILALNGYKNYVKLASGARAFVNYDQVGSVNDVTTKQVMDALHKHPELQAWCDVYCHHKDAKRIPSQIIGYLAICEQRHGYEKTKRFADRLFTGVGLESGDPELLMRSRFVFGAGRANMKYRTVRAWIVKAINASVTNKKIGVLKFNPEEADPMII